MVKKFCIYLPIILVIGIIVFLGTIKFNNTSKDNELVLNSIEQIQQLVTAKQIYREVIYSKETQNILWLPLKSKEFLIALDYTVTAGIDISKGFSIENKNGYRIITLPRAVVLSIDADDTSIEEYFVKENFSKLERDDYFKLIQESKEPILNGDNIDELLKRSEVNAKNLLESLLKLSGIDVVVVFADKVPGVLN